MENLAVVLFLISLILLVLIALSIINPGLRFFKSVFRKKLRRMQLIKRLGAVWLGTFILSLILMPPTTPGVTNLNIQKNQEVLAENFTVHGEVEGKLKFLKINDEEIDTKSSKFHKVLQLKPGDNEVKLVAIATVDDVDKEVKSESYNIYFDYEAMLYQEQLNKDAQEAEAIKRKLETVPNYEVVRKEGITDGFSAIIYVDGEPEDYLFTNVIKDFKSKNKEKNISVLLFQKRDKDHVEGDLESQDSSSIVPHVRANFEKRDSNEQFFLFPEGLEGRKLAVEV